MKEKHDKVDELKHKERDETIKKVQRANSNFGRIMKMTEPMWLVPIGLLFSLLMGTVMPIFGIILTKLLFGLDAKVHTLPEVRDNANFYCLMMLMCAISAMTFIFI